MLQWIYACAIAALIVSPAAAAPKSPVSPIKPSEAIEALASVIAVEEVVAVTCPEISVNQAAHAKFLANINPEKNPTIGPKDNKDLDASVEKHVKELQEDIKKLGVKQWCASSLEWFGGKGFPYPLLELKPTTEMKP
jgi:hypothetical protein